MQHEYVNTVYLSEYTVIIRNIKGDVSSISRSQRSKIKDDCMEVQEPFLPAIEARELHEESNVCGLLFT